MLSLGRIIIFVIFIFWGCSKKDNTLIQQVLPLFLANNHFNSSDSNPPPTNNPTSIPISIKYNSQSYVFIKGKNIIEVLPTVTGTILSYSINPSLPQGLSFQTENGKISGVASIESPATSYTITAFDKDGITTSTSIMIQIALPESYIELSNTSSPSTYSISIDETIWLSFDTVSGKKYSVHWLDSYNGSGNETADIVVSAYKSNKKDSYFLKADSGNIPGVIFLAAETDKVYLKVQAINSNSIGSFKLWIEQVPEQIVSTPLIVDEAAKTYN
ncbi:MAG: putative Ig domain-containing protein, partial [Leptospiraceae bacterium]|nr:putative Ig domain-containing protein [Leptospiraceae bacterium]